MDLELLSLLRTALGSARAATHLYREAGGLRRALETRGADLRARHGVAPRRAEIWDALRELRRRAAAEAACTAAPLRTPQELHAAAAPLFEGARRERFYVLAVDPKLRLVCPPILIGEGGPDSVRFSARQVFEPLLREDATAAFLAHNHPSGDPTPSAEDRALTARLTELGTALGLPILDHVIVGEGRFVSLVAGEARCA